VPRVVSRLALCGATAVAGLVFLGLPADACPTCGGSDLSNDGLIAQARNQMRQLNAGYNGNPSPNCNEEDALFKVGDDGQYDDGNDTVEHQGYLRWVPDFDDDPTPPTDGPSIEWYQQACYIPGPPSMELRAPSWQRFDAVTPENLALVAIDDMLSSIPQHTISVNPAADSMVAIDTWFWVDGGAVEPVSATASVPGVTVVATAEPGGVSFDLGDGTTLRCDDFGTPYAPGATSTCTHAYEAAGTYGITATILWRGSYTINGGAPIPIETGVERTASFTLNVNEAQAVNTPGAAGNG
jgi:hypothetical protein